MSKTHPFNPRVQLAFSRAAEHYDDVAILQHEIQSRLLDRLNFIEIAPSRVLDLGCGTGQATAQLKTRYPKAQVVGLDFSPAMLDQARGQSRWRRPINLVCGDIGRVPIAANSQDLLFSNLALQWCGDLDTVFAEFRRVLKPGGLVLFSTFGPGTLIELRQAWSTVDANNHVNGFFDMHDIGDAMVRAGFDRPVMDAERITETYPDVLAVLKSLKEVGAQTVMEDYPPGLTGRGRIKAMTKAYSQFVQDGRYPVSWEAVYGTAWAPKPGQPIRREAMDVATFSVDHLSRSKPQ